MNRRKFIGTVAGVAGLSTAAAAYPTYQQAILDPHPNQAPAGPYSIEIISPSEHAVRELPLFDSYKQAENFAQARMHLLRSNSPYWEPMRLMYTDCGVPHEAGIIKVWSNNGQVVYECAWGETWTMATSYVDCRGRLS